jgi:hypothetical protein
MQWRTVCQNESGKMIELSQAAMEFLSKYLFPMALKEKSLIKKG